MAATAAGIATPTALGAKECSTAGLDWITMSLEARNLAYNNVEHVGADNARKKTEGWAAASKTLREQRSRQFRNTRDVSEVAGSKGSLDCGEEQIGANRRNKSAGKTCSKQRQCDDIAADRAFSRGSKALAAQSQGAINNESRPRDHQ